MICKARQKNSFAVYNFCFQSCQSTGLRLPQKYVRRCIFLAIIHNQSARRKHVISSTVVSHKKKKSVKPHQGSAAAVKKSVKLHQGSAAAVKTKPQLISQHQVILHQIFFDPTSLKLPRWMIKKAIRSDCPLQADEI